MSRIAATLSTLKAQGRKALIPYVTAGFPYADITPELMHGMVAAGADVIELGVPFSDPSADGPVIQKAGDSGSNAAGATTSPGIGNPPHEVLLVIDGNTGQNALAQVRAFDAALGLTGLIVTKLDGTAKGGVLAAIAREKPIPVYFIGVGERLEELETFNAREFAQAILG